MLSSQVCPQTCLLKWCHAQDSLAQNISQKVGRGTAQMVVVWWKIWGKAAKHRSSKCFCQPFKVADSEASFWNPLQNQCDGDGLIVMLWSLLPGDHPKILWYQFIYFSDRLLTPLQTRLNSFKIQWNLLVLQIWPGIKIIKKRCLKAFASPKCCRRKTANKVAVTSTKASPFGLLGMPTNFLLGLLLGQFPKYILHIHVIM